ncbi:L,D-transpeptidase family protein [Spirosoma arcticum]
MRTLLLVSLLYLTTRSVEAQMADDWSRLRQYAHAIGVDSLCAQPDSACLTRYFTQIIYGRTPRRMSYQGLPERVDTAGINRLTHQFLSQRSPAEADWCPLLDSLEPQDRHYRQLIAYCMRCLVDDYMADSLTIEQVQETLNTYRWLNRFPADKRVVVNIPSATLRLIDRQGNTSLSSRVVVGKRDTPTPLFTASIPSLVTYPYWNVPRSITGKELLPKIRKNPVALLEAMKLHVINTKGQVVDPTTINWATNSFPYRLRQSTGCDNALGILKFNVTDPYDIYLHDTNTRQAFTKEDRQLSHGCIRVEKPAELANLLLGYTRFGADYLTCCPVNARPKTIPLPAAVPIIITYNLVDMDEAGAVQVYPDVYGWWQLAL